MQVQRINCFFKDGFFRRIGAPFFFILVGVYLNFIKLFLLTRVQLTRRAVLFFMLLLGASQEEAKKDARTFPPGPLSALPLYKE